MDPAVANQSVEFRVTAPLTGLWEDDKTRIQLVRLGALPHAPARLLMGFGPSASGKTHWTRPLLTLFSTTNPHFPKTLLSIDGGIQRATSIVYKAVVEEADRVCVLGFSNLVVAGMSMYTSLFDSDSVKNRLVEFLKRQTIPISLYVPETLGDCGAYRMKTCATKYADYLAITGDRASWIGLLIWQHKTADECDQAGARRCVGCTESGTAREIGEGKKYSNGAHAHSMAEGDKEIGIAPGGRYKIHNGGAAGRISLLQDLTVYTAETRPIQDALRAAQGAHAFVYEAVA